MKNWRALLLRILLTLVAVYAIASFLHSAPNFIGKSFFDSYDYKQTESKYLSDLEYYVLNAADQEITLDRIEVSKEEIDYYRNYYGTEADQLYDVQQQYELKIADAKNAEEPNEAYINSLIAERDSKLEEIRKNFTDDEVVKEKILAQKQEVVRLYFAKYNEEKRKFLDTYTFFGYSLTNKETGQKTTLNTGVTKIHRMEKVINPNLEKRQISSADYDLQEGLLQPTITILSPQNTYKGTVLITDDYLEESGLKYDYRGFMLSKWLNYVLWVIGLLVIVLLFTKYKWSLNLFDPAQPLYEKMKKMPIEMHIVLLLIIGSLAVSTFDSGSNIITNIAYGGRSVLTLSYIFRIIFGLAFRLFILSATIILAWGIIKRLMEQSQAQLWNDSICARFWHVLQSLFLNRSIGIQTLFMFFVFFLGGFGLFIGAQETEAFIIYSLLFMFVLVPVTFKYLYRMSYLNKIMQQTEKMAEGKLTEPIKVKGNSPFAKHAEHLNALQEGVRHSTNEKAKSERLKTELITNVSHDLRTPLTSIITYTDLLKNPDITPEEREQYVTILDKKAERLKVLIEDLFEVSKMASGNMELVKQRVDVAQLLQQIVGEHISDFETSNLDMKVSIMSKPLYANVDGQKLWRVLDNLLNNARKYSLTGTRVYVDLRQQQERILLTVKNVSQYELDGDAEELVERFKRADLARHTEGSGLGLAIATSIVQLHGGTLNISADGDLFKVTVVLPC